VADRAAGSVSAAHTSSDEWVNWCSPVIFMP
jgi:hypothetical protein